MIKKALLILFVLILAFGISAKDLMKADLPIRYGKERFIQRIEERTGGVREPIGLVLSGGSARAFAHIGVLRYLEEIGIVPDFIVSNSMGSIVGMLYAAGLSPDQILAITSSTSLETLFDLALPMKGGLLDASRFLERISSILGRDLRMEELEIPIIVTAEDLVTKRQIQIGEGDFYTVLVASFALPVYFPPVSYHEHRLIDGGITNLVPVGIAGELTDSIILSTTFYENEELNLDNPVTILNVAFDISKRRRGIEEMKALEDSFIWIRNDVESISFMEFAKVMHIQEKGYEAAKAHGEALARLERGVPVSSFAKRREELDAAIRAADLRYATYEHLCRFDDASTPGIGIWSTLGGGVRSHLIDDVMLGISSMVSRRALSLEINGGLAFNWARSGQMRTVPALKTRLYYYFLDHWRVAFGGGVFYDAQKNGFLFSYGGLLEGRYPLGGIVDLGMSQTFEGLSNGKNSGYVEGFPGNTFLAASTVTLELPSLRWLEKGVVDFSYQAYGDYRRVRSFLNPHGCIKIRDPFIGIYLEGKSSARFAVDGKGDVPLFVSDRFRTNHDPILTRGHDLAVSNDPANHLVTVNLGMGYQPVSYRPTFGEMFLFEESRVGVFADLLFNGEFFFSAGLEVETTISLLGITELGVRLYGGLDWASRYPIWGIYFIVTR